MRRLPLAASLLAAALALAACGDGAESADTTTAPSTTAEGTTTTIDPARCFDIPAEAATIGSTVPATTVAPTSEGETTTTTTTLADDQTTTTTTTEPATTVPPTATPGIEPGDYAAGPQPEAVRPCDPPVEGSGLRRTVLRPGTGREATLGDHLYIDYIGVRSATGEVFDQSYGRGTPFNFDLGLGRVIQGWDEGLIGVQTGSLIRLDIPADLAYANSPSGDIIQPGDALTFVTEVRLVVAGSVGSDSPSFGVVPSTGATETTWKDAVEGTGPALTADDTAVIHVIFARGDNRVVLLNTWEDNSPATFSLDPDSGNLVGLINGLHGAQVGTVRVITIPPADAFGDEGNLAIGLPPATDMIAIVEVLGIL